MRYGMVIDLKRCFGCQACSTSCKMANNLPEGVFYSRVRTKRGLDDEGFAEDLYMDTAVGSYPDDLRRVQVPLSCQHCAKPMCLEVCPTGATQKDEETGIVTIDPERCIGCKSCIRACPYDGVRTYVEGEPQYHLGFAVGEKDAPVHSVDVVEKCTLCKNRVDRGELPKCVEACIGNARFFGDLDDPESEVSKLIAVRDAIQVLASAGTGPSIFYLQ